MTRNSPTSIIIYNQCPRFYYYTYKEKRPSFPNIVLIKGKVVHKALEEFFQEEVPIEVSNFHLWASKCLKKLFMRAWEDKRPYLQKLQITNQEVKEHYDECWEMLDHWLSNFLKKIENTELHFNDAFEKLKPLTEDRCYFKKYDIRGFIDVIESYNGEVRVIDYKTSSKFELTKEHKLQLAIYALLYKQKYGEKPDKVGIYFLRERLHLISVDDTMVNYAERECKNVYEKTRSNNIKDYPQNTGYLCKALKENCPCRLIEESIE